MKKLIIGLFLTLLIGIVGVAGYFIMNPDVSFASVTSITNGKLTDDQSKPTIGALKEHSTEADVFEALDYEITKNRDTVAWLSVPNSHINNSVVQSHDNLYYLRRDERKEEAIYGCYFVDAECNVENRAGLSQNTVIYGHSDLKDNPDGSRFSQLFRYVDAEYANENRIITLTTPEDMLQWEVMAVFYTDITFDYIRVNMTDDEKVMLLEECVEKSIHDFGIKPQKDDKFLTLSTCSVKYGADGNHRFVVMARLLDQ